MLHRGPAVTSALRLAATALLLAGCGQAPPADVGPLTFTRDVAPILFDNCAPCHRPGESGPFDLLTYADARKRAGQIADVTADRYMPPWKPDPGYGDFVGRRGLTEEQIAVLRGWAEQGAPEGDVADLPEPPVWPDGWQVGAPDLVVSMEPYTLGAGAGDVFRNFVIPLPLDGTRHVRAVELRPGNAQAVHHAVIMLDRSGAALAQDAADEEPGFDGMEFGELQRVGGHFLGWAPGTTPYEMPDSLSWTLEAGDALVLQLHMLPTGKPEQVGAQVGLVFSDTPPTRAPMLLRLGRKDIDIPAGESQYTIEDAYFLPADADVLSIYPHAHYLGKRMEAWAVLPDGSTEHLLRISDWDFNWQNYYRYRTPVRLPRGTALHMRYTYDNSAQNERNPHIPPRHVRYGTQSEDEMGDLIVQLLPRTQAGEQSIRRDYSRHWLRQEVAGYETLLLHDPDNAEHHQVLGVFYMSLGAGPKAIEHLRAAIRLRPEVPEAHLNLATVLHNARQPKAAETHLRKALQLRPTYGEAHLNLGMLLGQSGRIAEALVHLDSAAALQPELAAEIRALTDRVRGTSR